MGDVGSAIATPFVAVATAVTGQANKKIYYDCPRCGKEVWVYAAGAAFAGRKCINCRGKSGPIDLGIVGDVVDVAITPITGLGAIVTGNANEKIWYNCPKCDKRKWVSAMAPHLTGKICLDCKPLGFRSVESLHPFGQAASINDIKKDTSKFCGSIIYQKWGQHPNKDYSNGINLNDKITWYEAHSCRILHGSVSWLANTMVQTATFGQADLIDHWWTTIKTQNGCYYQLQFRGLGLFNDNGLIELRKCCSSDECDQNGLAEACKESDADTFTENTYCNSFSNPSYTMGDVVKWIKSDDFSAKYSVTHHNCQDMCKAFWRKF
eukprot:883694_1